VGTFTFEDLVPLECRWAFRELRDIAEMKFRFAEEEDACEYVTRVAGEAHQYAPAHVLKVRVPST
jgi:secreted Zn-dependent insulinase-like peptidase